MTCSAVKGASSAAVRGPRWRLLFFAFGFVMLVFAFGFVMLVFAFGFVMLGSHPRSVVPPRYPA